MLSVLSFKVPVNDTKIGVVEISALECDLARGDVIDRPDRVGSDAASKGNRRHLVNAEIALLARGIEANLVAI